MFQVEEGVALLLLLHRKFLILLREFKRDTRKLKKEINAAKTLIKNGESGRQEVTLMDEIKKNILWIGLGIIIFETYGLVIGIPNGLLLSSKNWMELVGILAEILVLFLFSYAFYKLGKYDFASKITAKNIVFLFLAIAVCLIANFGVSHISMMMHKPMQNNSSVNQILSIISTKRFAFRPFFWCLNIGIIVPFLEEIVFRGIIQGYVFESLNAVVRIIAISVLFTIGQQRDRKSVV